MSEDGGVTACPGSSTAALSAISRSSLVEVATSPVMDDALSLALQKHVGGYALGHVLGVGAFGEVRLGQNLESGDIVAVKIVAEDEGKACRLPNEVVAILQRLKGHQNIAELLEVVSEVPLRATWCRSCACTEYKAGERFGQCRSCSPHDRCDHSIEEIRPVTLLVLEPAIGGELFAVVKEAGSLPEPIARFYFIQLCNALGHCHNNGVAHRDLRLENLVINHNLQLKMIDFGLAALANDSHAGAEGRAILLPKPLSGGQILYAAPETLIGDYDSSYMGEPADIWSAAVILFIMLTGRPPFRRPVDRHIHPLMRRCEHFVQLQAGNYPSKISPTARDLLMAMFSQDPCKRIRLDEIVKHDWVTQGSIPDQRELHQFMYPNITSIHAKQNKQCFSNVLRRLWEQSFSYTNHSHAANNFHADDDEKSESSAIDQSVHIERIDDSRGL